MTRVFTTGTSLHRLEPTAGELAEDERQRQRRADRDAASAAAFAAAYPAPVVAEVPPEPTAYERRAERLAGIRADVRVLITGPSMTTTLAWAVSNLTDILQELLEEMNTAPGIHKTQEGANHS